MTVSLAKLRKTILIITFGLVSGWIGYWLGTHKIKIGSGKLEFGSKQLPVQKVQIINNTIPTTKDLDFSLFWQVWTKLEEKYLERDKIDQENMFYGAIKGMVASLGDPYTVFLPPEDNQQAKEDLNGSFGGVGIRLGYIDKTLAVISPLKGSPAEQAGVRAGDLILHIKDEIKGIDEDTIGISLPDAVNKIRGENGTQVILTIFSEGDDEPKDVAITRGEIVVPSVEAELLNDKAEESADADVLFAHLKLMRFGDLTAEQWDESVQKILDKEPRVKGIILDLRGNPGGYLKGSINLASEFLDGGVIVKQENYLGEIETYSVNRRGRLLNIPMIVLIDKGSASASEILAGALRDYGRAKLVGETSFGKGTIQETEELPYGAGLHITTAKWLTPNDIYVNKTGLKPDVEVTIDPENPDDDKQLKEAIKILSNE